VGERFGNQIALSTSNKKREPRPRIQVLPGALLVWSSMVWWLGSVTSPERNGLRRNAPR
jgi:hypothetical protein